MDTFNEMHGYFVQHNHHLMIVGTTLVILGLGFWGAPLIVWTVALAVLLIGFNAPLWLIIGFAVVMAVFNIPPIRALLVSAPVLKIMKAMGLMPTISETERTAINAGTTWAEKELFSGKPDFNKLMNEPYPDLTPEEKAFLEGPVEQLCAMLDDWAVWKNRDLPQEAWDFIKKE